MGVDILSHSPLIQIVEAMVPHLRDRLCGAATIVLVDCVETTGVGDRVEPALRDSVVCMKEYVMLLVLQHVQQDNSVAMMVAEDIAGIVQDRMFVQEVNAFVFPIAREESVVMMDVADRVEHVVGIRNNVLMVNVCV